MEPNLALVDSGLAVAESSNFWPVLFLILGLVILLVIVKKLIKKFAVENSHLDQMIFLVRMPKEKPKDEGGATGLTTQQLREAIAQGETIFSGIGGLKADRGLRAWLFGREDHFSFEIVAHNSKISFYVAAPRAKALYLEQQIHAHYPEASIEEVDDYNAFTSRGAILSAFLRPKRNFIFPFKTYNDMEADPMNSIVNVMSKLELNESVSVQYVVRSAKRGWHKVMKDVVSKAYKIQSVSEVFKISTAALTGFSNFIIHYIILGPFNMLETKAKDNEVQRKELTEKEKEMLKKMEEKNSKAGLDINLRLVVAAPDKLRAQMYLDNMASAYSEYNYYEYGNTFGQAIKTNQQKIINNFIYRRFIKRQSFLLNTEEICSLFHFPLPHTETPNIDWLVSKTAPAPNNIPNEGIILGYNIFRGIKTNIRVKRLDRRRHCYAIGKSGTGKSVLLANMAIQDIENGDGVCIMEPNGDLIEDILNRIPPERAEDVIVFSPADMERPMGLNLLEFDERYPEQKSFVINEMIGIFDKLYDLKATGGPMF